MKGLRWLISRAIDLELNEFLTTPYKIIGE